MSKKEVRSGGILFIVSAPSGAGKTTLCRKAVDYFPDLRHSISYTTRSAREGEKNGVDYHFASELIFQKMLDNSEFLEWARVHGNKYGTSVTDTQAILEKGLDIILDIDVQGAAQVKKKSMSAVFIFIFPPSLETTKERIRNRGKDSDKAILDRLEAAKKEIKEAKKYDYFIINDNLDDAFERLKSIIIAERSKKERMLKKVKRLLDVSC